MIRELFIFRNYRCIKEYKKIDEHEKMKQKSTKPRIITDVGGMNVSIAGAAGAKCDNSADEILGFIASAEKYKFMNKEVDCSRTLFLVTTNETREEIEKNPGIGGVESVVGAQRFDIIEFDDFAGSQKNRK